MVKIKEKNKKQVIWVGFYLKFPIDLSNNSPIRTHPPVWFWPIHYSSTINSHYFWGHFLKPWPRPDGHYGSYSANIDTQPYYSRLNQNGVIFLRLFSSKIRLFSSWSWSNRHRRGFWVGCPFICTLCNVLAKLLLRNNGRACSVQLTCCFTNLLTVLHFP